MMLRLDWRFINVILRYKIRGIQYVLSIMRKCIMVKVEGSKTTKRNKNRGGIYKFC